MTNNLVIPEHLKKFVVDQSYERYTWEDQAVWRYILRQLKDYLTTHGHPVYTDGLSKTGISVEKIPKISEIDNAIKNFGWRALPVSGFIPPAAFMEFQSLGILPIASDMRSIEHILYTPAPDIVHEAAGHAPILVDEGYSDYLRAYAKAASKAIISKQDVDLYEAIRLLSDIKEHPDSSLEEIKKAEKNVERASNAIKYVSEAGFLSRMNWWTAEYGLVGDIKAPKIFGAGLLSSVGEAKHCLSNGVKKINLDLNCIDYSYDITEKQPQLFVTPNFEHLKDVLEQLTKKMAYRTGGLEGCNKAILAETINTIELNSGIQVSGKLVAVKTLSGHISFLKFEGPAQLSKNGKQINGHGPDYHKHGFSSPIGKLTNNPISLEEMNEQNLKNIGLIIGKSTTLSFEAGIIVKGIVKDIYLENGKPQIVSFDNCHVQLGSEILFEPSWGTFDMICGSKVTSVFGGPADRAHLNDDVGFVAARVPQRKMSEETLKKYNIFHQLRSLREKQYSNSTWSSLVSEVTKSFSNEWLLLLELYELGIKQEESHSLTSDLKNRLLKIAESNVLNSEQIADGIRLAQKKL